MLGSGVDVGVGVGARAVGTLWVIWGPHSVDSSSDRGPNLSNISADIQCRVSRLHRMILRQPPSCILSLLKQQPSTQL